jgi:hypothetical protein
MLFNEKLKAALIGCKEGFARFDNQWRDEIHSYTLKLNAVSEKSSKEITDALGYEKTPGAFPSDDLDKHKKFFISFSEHWRNHEEARRWANVILQNRTTFAADASQLIPGREISLPVAVIQAAWFENNHRGENDYVKDVCVEIIPPEELLEQNEGRIKTENIVGLRRFKLEVEALTKFLEKKRGWQERKERMPLAFLDGTILISISQPKTDLEGHYVDAMVALVHLSQETKVPLVGFIDQSYARDLVTMLDTMNETPKSERSRSLYDAQFLHESREEKFWGDRTAFCYCKRKGLNEFFHDEEDKPIVGFVYLQTTGEGIPARLDVPSWIYEEGLLDEVVDVVRAECVIGLGYPYAIETADQTAVIRAQDRERFFSAMQEFANHNQLSFRVSRKAMSKMRRR